VHSRSCGRKVTRMMRRTRRARRGERLPLAVANRGATVLVRRRDSRTVPSLENLPVYVCVGGCMYVSDDVMAPRCMKSPCSQHSCHRVLPLFLFLCASCCGFTLFVFKALPAIASLYACVNPSFKHMTTCSTSMRRQTSKSRCPSSRSSPSVFELHGGSL